MDPLTLAAVGAALGLAKSELVDRPNEKRQRTLQAEMQRWSPWTGMQGADPKNADPFGSALQGGLAFGALGQGINANKAATSGVTSLNAANNGGYTLGLANPASQAMFSPGAGLADPKKDLYTWYGLSPRR